MPTMLVYDPNKAEINLIRDELSVIREAADLHFFGTLTIQEFFAQANRVSELSVSCADFEAGGETAVRIARDRDPATLPIIIADSKTSPLAYVRPDIMAAGLLLRPLSQKLVADTLREVLDVIWMREREHIFNNKVFTFAVREGVIRVPYAQILYFEARNKRIVVCTNRAETEFYSTLENLMSELPEYFLRCHKGYIVNTLLVHRVDLHESTLHLASDFQVPFSKSYKTAVKEALLCYKGTRFC